jgi:chromosome segregation ATPase
VAVDDRALNDLRQLALRDAEFADQAVRLRELDAEVAEIRTAAETVDRFFAGYPAEDTARRDALREAEAELARRRDELRDAESTLAQARDDDARAHARYAIDRAHDHVAVAESGLARAREAHGELEREAAALPERVPALEERAAAIASEVPDVPASGKGPRALIDWASHAHAELFVAAGHIDTQRERMIREANELASMLTGEPTYGSTTAQALARAELR